MNGFHWDWAFTWEVLPLILSAAKVTLLATLLGSIFAIVVGLVFALLRRNNSRIVRISTY